MRFDKAAIVVLDGVGVGGAPDAAAFGDEGSDTLGNTARAVGGLELPNLASLGLGLLADIDGVARASAPRGFWGRMREASAGKDTTTGHWEISGVPLHQPMPTYPDGFPNSVMEEFRRVTGAEALGNEVASGTEIIDRLGEEHQRTGRLIVYTSADSVFQIAGHEETLSLSELYRICSAMRESLTDEHAVGRVIARPFVGEPGAFERTTNRRDFSLEPPGNTILDLVSEAGLEVISVGKIDDIFANRGITGSHHVLPNQKCIDATIQSLKSMKRGLVFTNLIEFDMNFGHRNDPAGMAQALRELDARIPELLEAAGDDTILAFTADHGNDPTTPSTDHSREEVPLLIHTGRPGRDLGTRPTFADLGATIADNFGLSGLPSGTSFLGDLVEGVAKREDARDPAIPWAQLSEQAREAAENAYAPYSEYAVGAALWTSSGEIVAGCNVENVSYGLAICAERNAIFAARARGLIDPGNAPVRAAVVYAPARSTPWPCGACRQVLREFGAETMPIRIEGPHFEEETTLGELLPRSFRLESS